MTDSGSPASRCRYASFRGRHSGFALEGVGQAVDEHRDHRTEPATDLIQRGLPALILRPVVEQGSNRFVLIGAVLDARPDTAKRCTTYGIVVPLRDWRACSSMA